MQIHVLTLFPEIFSGYLSQSILHKAIQNKLVDVQLHDYRNWAKGPHNKVDDRPYGGGPGMVMMVEPVVEAVENVLLGLDAVDSSQRELVVLSPVGRKLDQPCVEALAKKSQLVLMCGRYEGFDQRIIDILQPTELSVGDYVLNGGESAAMVVIDAVIRLIPGVLGDQQSNVEDSFSTGNRMLEFPQYTRPPEFRGHRVPDVLTGGNHAEIENWRKQQSSEITRARRNELLND